MTATHVPISTLDSTPTLLPTLPPTPTPTATPIPPLVLNIDWPEQVSALEPVFVQVELIPPPGISVTATVRASITGPGEEPSWSFDLMPKEGNWYVAQEPAQFPIEPREGDWLLVVYVRSSLDVAGERYLTFSPDPVHFRDLTDILPAGVDMHVPQDFVEIVAKGDQWSGGRVWRFGDAEIALWWAPGPAEPLLFNNATVMLETTHNPNEPPTVLGVEETEWQKQISFLFHEDWSAVGGGTAEAVVIQGLDRWLYVLRTRTLSDESIPILLRQVQETFTLVDGEE
ncbi:MAG: hypothetical protein GY832_34990 [Chloroflexi bacterium]|nr:hypothetical protein [Chloroflexota bacterium]